jgi:HSP20 family protein
MANHKSTSEARQGSTTMARAGDGERGMATRQYQDPFSLLDSLFERMQRDFFGTTLVNAMLPSGGDGNGGAIRVPRLQIRDTGDAIALTAELPGIPPENVRVELEGDVLTISGEARQEEERDGERVEQQMSFYRQITLPDGIDADQAQASYTDGVLTIRFPKRAERGNARQIPVSTEQTAKDSGQQAQDRAA